MVIVFLFMPHTVDSCALLVKETRKLNFLASHMEKAESNYIKNPPKTKVWKVSGKEKNRCLLFVYSLEKSDSWNLACVLV